MKKVFLILGILIFGMGNSQVIIGDNVGTASNKTSVLLEFANGQNKGIILPYLRTIPTGAGLVEGTIILDASTSSSAKVLYYNGVTTDGKTGWVDLSSGHGANVSTFLSEQPLSTGANAVVEDEGAKAIIGAETTSAQGVLVLESNTKAMVLPMVESTDNVLDPAPGMMVFINKTGAKRLAVFNGEGWTYWKP